MVEASVLIVPFPVKVIPLLVPRVISAVVCNVPPLKIILSASADPGVAPSALAFVILMVPAEMVVVPE